MFPWTLKHEQKPHYTVKLRVQATWGSKFCCSISQMSPFAHTWFFWTVFLLRSAGTSARCGFCTETSVLQPRSTDHTHCNTGLPRAPVKNRKGKKQIVWNYPSYRKIAYFCVMSAEHNPRTIFWPKQPNYMPQKQDIFGFSEITYLPKETHKGSQLKYDSMALQKRTKDSHFLSPRIGISLSFHFLKEFTQHLRDSPAPNYMIYCILWCTLRCQWKQIYERKIYSWT